MPTHRTLGEALKAKRRGDRTISYIDGEKDERTVGFGDLYKRAMGILCHLQSRGLVPGDELGLFTDSNEQFFLQRWYHFVRHSGSADWRSRVLRGVFSPAERAPRRQTMKHFLPYFTFLRPVKHLFIAALLFGVVHGVTSGFGLPFVTEKVFPKLFGNPDPSLWALVASVAILPAAFFVRGLAGYFNTYLMTFCGIQVLKGIQLRVYRKVQSLPLEFFHPRKSGDLLARILGDTAVLQQTLTVTANDLIKQPITFLGAVGALIYFSLKHHELAFVLICLAIIPVLVLPIRYMGNKLLKKSRQLQGQGGIVYNLVQENLLARTDVRLFNLQESQVTKFKTQVELFQKFQMKVTKYNAMLRPSVEFLSTIGVAAAILYATRAGITLESIIPLTVALFVSYKPLKSFGALWAALKRGLASLDRLEVILHAADLLADPAEPVSLGVARGEIEFRGVDFHYTDEPVLHNVNQRIPAGQIVALAGPSGAGKTSFANLIPRLYDVRAGQVLIDGVDVRHYRKSDLRDQIGIVAQDAILFNDTVRNNILIGRADATDEDVVRAAKQAFAHDFIESLEHGYETVVGERGTRLSGGQRQRIALARAFVKNAPILILDEATSNLDSQSEAMIQEAMASLIQGRTTLIIAHRFSTLKIAQQILLFDEGRIVAAGSNEELFANSARYRTLYDR